MEYSEFTSHLAMEASRVSVVVNYSAQSSLKTFFCELRFLYIKGQEITVNPLSPRAFLDFPHFSSSNRKADLPKRESQVKSMTIYRVP